MLIFFNVSGPKYDNFPRLQRGSTRFSLTFFSPQKCRSCIYYSWGHWTVHEDPRYFYESLFKHANHDSDKFTISSSLSLLQPYSCEAKDGQGHTAAAATHQPQGSRDYNAPDWEASWADLCDLPSQRRPAFLSCRSRSVCFITLIEDRIRSGEK